MKHFGMVALGIPSDLEDPTLDGAKGYADNISFAVLENADSEGMDHPAGEIKDEDGKDVLPDAFEVFRFSDDMVDFTKLSGIAVYYLGDKKGCKKVLLRSREMSGAVLLTGWIDGEGPVCFHTEQSAREIIEWFCRKQAVWYAQYKYTDATEEAGGTKEGCRGEGSSGQGQTCH
jgi:hypothetical protein